MAISLNLLPWCVNTSESSSELWLHSSNISAPGRWLYPLYPLCTIQELSNHSAGGLFQQTRAKPQCAFLVGGLVGSEWHWPYQGDWGCLFCSLGKKLPGLCPKFGQSSPRVYIIMLTLPRCVRDGMQYKYPCSRLFIKPALFACLGSPLQNLHLLNLQAVGCQKCKSIV